jgi:hypothetical protein
MAKGGRRNNWILVLCPRCGREISSNPSHRKRHEDACGGKERVVRQLLAAGYRACDATPTERVRIGTASAPVFGGVGGKLVTFGGRDRFRLRDSDQYATVGPRTTCFYRRDDNGTSDMESIPSSDDGAVGEAISRRTKPRAAAPVYPDDFDESW